MMSYPYTEPARWPDYFPPFLEDAVRSAPDGRLWIRRSTLAGEQPAYDIIDAAGRLVEHLRFPARTRIVGFGEGVIYAVRQDEDDLEHLERFRLPAR